MALYVREVRPESRGLVLRMGRYGYHLIVAHEPAGQAVYEMPFSLVPFDDLRKNYVPRDPNALACWVDVGVKVYLGSHGAPSTKCHTDRVIFSLLEATLA